MEWPMTATPETPGRAASASTAARASAANSPTDSGEHLGRVGAAAPNVDDEHVEPGRVEIRGVREHAVAGALPAVDEHDAGGNRLLGRDVPRRQRGTALDARHHDVLPREANDRGRVQGRVGRGYPARARYTSANRYARARGRVVAATIPTRRVVRSAGMALSERARAGPVKRLYSSGTSVTHRAPARRGTRLA